MGVATKEHQAVADLISEPPAFAHRGPPDGLSAQLWRRAGVAQDPAHLTRRYVFALTLVAVLSMVGQALVQDSLTLHAEDARVINVAGRQRMLSQRITKAALAMRSAADSVARRSYRDEMSNVLGEWTQIHRALRHGDDRLALRRPESPSVGEMFARIEESFVSMASSSEALIALEPGADPHRFDAAVERLLASEPAFLSTMDDIVNRFQEAADARVTEVRVIELGLFCLVLATLLVEGLFIFKPAVARIRETWQRLDEASNRLGRSEAEKSAMLRAIPDAMFRLDRRGTIRAARPPSVSAPPAREPLRDGAVSGAECAPSLPDPESGQFLARALPGVSDRYLAQAEAAIATGVVTSFEYPIVVGGATRHVEARFAACGAEEVLVIVRDLTERRELEREILAIGERERERIGQDIHDGLCQLLAGIRLRVESLAVRAGEGAVLDATELQSIGDLARQALAVASGVARGLFIASLSDGLPSALTELISSVSAVHPVACTHDIRLDGAQLPRNVALQMYRIAQEALNNAIKHARASRVHATLQLDGTDVVMTIADDGIGIPDAGARRHGMGLSIMQSRARMIDAVLSIGRIQGRTVTRDGRTGSGDGDAVDGSGGGTLVRCRLTVGAHE